MAERRLIAGAVIAATVALASAGLSQTGGTVAGYTDKAAAEVPVVAAQVGAAVQPVRTLTSLDTTVVLVDGQLWMWGFYGDGANPGGGKFGARGWSTAKITDNKPHSFPALSNIISVSSNAYAFKAVTSDGKLWSWGLNNYDIHGPQNGVIGLATSSAPTWVPLDTGVVETVSGEYHSAWLKQDGTVWMTGNNLLGNRGVGHTAYIGATPNKIAFPAGAASIASIAGVYEGTYAVDSEGKVFYWGRDHRGGAALGVGGDRIISTPTEVPALTALVQAEGFGDLSGGYAYGALLTKKGNVYTWGAAENNANGHANGTYGAGAGKDVYTPKLLTTDVKMLSATFMAGRVLKTDGTVWAWGSYEWGGPPYRNSAGVAITSYNLVRVYDGSLGKAVGVGGNKDSGSYFLEDGSMWTWGENGAGAACSGLTYANCPQAKGTLYVWPAHRVVGIGAGS